MENILNNIYVRIIMGVFIGIPFTSTALFAGAHGLILGYAGIVEEKFSMAILGILTITGFIGIIGAWLRIIEPTSSMSSRYLKITRLMLYSSFITSVSLTIWAFYLEGLTETSMPVIILIVGSILFIAATPKSSNNAFKRGVNFPR